MTKTFSMRHLAFKGKAPYLFQEDSPPEWMLSHEYIWWWKTYVLTLKVNDSIESDFHEITRVS